MLDVYTKPVMKSPNRPPVGTNPKGKPLGGNGGARKIPEKVDKTIEVNFSKEKLKELKRKYGNKLKIEKVEKYVYDIPVIKMFVTLFIIERIYLGRKLIAQATHPELPKKGQIGNRLKSWIISLKNEFAGSCEKVAEHIEDMTGESFSRQAIKDCVHRTGEELEPFYRELGTKLREAEVVGGDTSSWRVNGINYILWLFCTFNIVYIHIDKSKSRKILLKILGNEFLGAFVSDCAPEFQKFARFFQKCFSHLLRTTYTLSIENPKKDIFLLHQWLTNLFNEMKDFLDEDPPPDKREKMFNYFDGKLEDIINHNWKSKWAISIVKNRLIKFRNDWCTAILFSGVPLTNNDTESHIRTAIPTRKMLGGHRTEEGAEYYAITQSLILTWRLRGLSAYHEMIMKFEEMNSEFIYN
jgi:transposase